MATTKKITYAIINTPIAAVTAEAKFGSEMISQLLYNEIVIVHHKKNIKWLLVTNLYDNYTGYILASHVAPITYSKLIKIKNIITPTSTYIINTQGAKLLLPMGCNSFGFENITDIHVFENTFTEGKIIKTAMQYLGVSYLWGGRSNFGIDCSGFTQMVYRYYNTVLPRDAWQQQLLGTLVTNLSNIKVGDLAFFANKEGKIIHVGMLLPNCKIIHAAGTVRIDDLTKHGILNSDTSKYTHKLHSIKRVMG